LDSQSRLATQPARRFVLNTAGNGFSFVGEVITSAPEVCMYSYRLTHNSVIQSHV
jgi:hypothetical protein